MQAHSTGTWRITRVRISKGITIQIEIHPVYHHLILVGHRLSAPARESTPVPCEQQDHLPHQQPVIADQTRRQECDKFIETHLFLCLILDSEIDLRQGYQEDGAAKTPYGRELCHVRYEANQANQPNADEIKRREQNGRVSTASTRHATAAPALCRPLYQPLHIRSQ